VSRVNPDRGDLAGRWLSKFLTDHLAGERDLSPQTGVPQMMGTQTR